MTQALQQPNLLSNEIIYLKTLEVNDPAMNVAVWAVLCVGSSKPLLCRNKKNTDSVSARKIQTLAPMPALVKAGNNIANHQIIIGTNN